MFSVLTLLSFLTLAQALPQTTSSSDCTGTIESLDDVSAAVQCTTVNILSFTVPGGTPFELDLLQGTIVNVLGHIQFGNMSWDGPLFAIKGEDITFNGNGYTLDGGGPFYWDGGSNSVTKPDPMMWLHMSGTLSGVHVVNTPKRAIAVNNIGPLTISHFLIDDSQGNYPNAKSDGAPAGRNTDGFDVYGNDVTIKDSTVINQDDCLAINCGQNIVFEDNYCYDGHGISIGSISSNIIVDGVVIRGNTVFNSMQAFRIKTDRDASNSRVSNISYYDNTASNCTEYGLLITQSYPEVLGKPGTDVIISDVRFSPGMTDLNVISEAKSIAVNCGVGCCQGLWDWSGLKTSGGQSGQLNNLPTIEGYSL